MLGPAQEFVAMLDLRPNERVLDVGCGIGEPPHKCLWCGSLDVRL